MAAELAFRSLTELAGGLRRKEFSSRELVDHYLARIDRANKKLHAYVEVYAESARAAADAADIQRAAGMPVGRAELYEQAYALVRPLVAEAKIGRAVLRHYRLARSLHATCKRNANGAFTIDQQVAECDRTGGRLRARIN